MRMMESKNCQSCTYVAKRVDLSLGCEIFRDEVGQPKSITDMRHPSGACGPEAAFYSPSSAAVVALPVAHRRGT